MKNLLKVLFALSTIYLTFFTISFANRGFIIPPYYYIEENSQAAIVLYNGNEEAIILATSLKGNSTVIEFLPLPSLPNNISEINQDVFEALIKLVNKKFMEGSTYAHKGLSEEEVSIVFSKVIGVHNVTIVEASNASALFNFILNFSQSIYGKNIEIDKTLKNTLEEYIDNGIKYFVFDVVNLSSKESSQVKPLMYKFKSDYIFYPIKVTSLTAQGYCYLQIYLLTSGKINFTNDLIKSFGKLSSSYQVRNFYLTKGDLKSIEELKEIANFFNDDCYLSIFSYYGRIEELDKDLIIEKKYIKGITFTEKVYNNLKNAIERTPFYKVLKSCLEFSSSILSILPITFLLFSIVGTCIFPIFVYKITKRKTKGKKKRKLRKALLILSIALSLIILFIDLGVVTYALLGIFSIFGIAITIGVIVKLMRKI